MSKAAVSYAKPGNRYAVEHRRGKGWVVLDPDARFVWGPDQSWEKAEQTRERLQSKQDQKAKRCLRACMRCGSEFQSEGFHNRMCGSCRLRGGDAVPASFSYSAARRSKQA